MEASYPDERESERTADKSQYKRRKSVIPFLHPTAMFPINPTISHRAFLADALHTPIISARNYSGPVADWGPAGYGVFGVR